MDIDETMLPGVGIRYEFTTRHGDRMGLIAYRDGKVDLLCYDPDDPDVSTMIGRLDRVEADAVAELLGAPRIVERFADLTKEIPGLLTEKVRLDEESPYASEPLGDTRCRTRTGASIVAIVRGDDVIASPSPDELLLAGDRLVVIGTADGVAEVRELLGAH
ncbi:MAG: cation:proton antiporter regulatory subunit [Actinobacteria bacterium]|nr:cation:proton antiporter regulatory subunit [Actinomycetota bacterium]